MEKRSEVTTMPSPRRSRLNGRKVVPFSPRHGEANRQNIRRSPRSRSGSPAPTSSKSQVASSSSSQTRKGQKRGSSPSIEDSSQQAMKKMKKLTEATRNMVEAQNRKRGLNASGIIKSITLWNFMCHKSFHQEWHENLNFVVGENGSGKSALLSGLMIGLGGKALSTSRTSSVKDLIKTGESHAKTEVVLLNKGKLPVETYGERISIQRIINSAGQSTYKLQYGLGGRLKNATKQELDYILRSLDIQLENPVVILNQEYARSFLRSKDPKNKYKLFEDGTGTGECDKIRFQVHQTLEEIEKTLDAKKEDLENLRKTYKDCEDKVKLVEGLGTHQETLRKLDLELKWYYVHIEENKGQELDKELAQLNARNEKAKRSYEQSVEEIKRIESDKGPSQAEILEQRHLKQDSDRKRDATQKEINEFMAAKVHANMKVKDSQTELPKKRHKLATLERKVQTTEEKVKQDREVLLSKLQAEKDRLRLEIEAQEKVVASIDEQRNKYYDERETLRNQIESMNSKRENVRQQIEIRQRQLQNLQSSSSNLAAFENSRQLQTLVDRIKANEKRFTKPPRGPIGACFTVKDEKYVKIVQYVLRNVLYDFVVNDGKDANLITSMMDQIYGKSFRGRIPSIHIIKYHTSYDYSRTNCSRDLPFPTVLDQLVFEGDDHIIRNALLDVQEVERILLFKNPPEALTILAHKEKVPKFCRLGYTFDYYKITPDPFLRVDAMQLRNFGNIVRTDRKAQIRNLELELATMTDEMQNFVVDPAVIKEEKRLTRQERECDQVRREKKIELSVLKQKYTSVREPPDRAADLASVKEELEEVKVEIEELEKKAEEYKIKLTETLHNIETKQAEKKEIEREIHGIQKKLQHFAQLKDSVRERVEQAQQFADRFKRAYEKTSEDLNACKRRIELAIAKIQEVTAVASQVGERVPVTRGSADIKREHDEVKARMEHLQQFAQRHENIRERYEAVKKRYKKYSHDMRMVSKMFQKVMVYFKNVNLHYLIARDRITQALTKCYEEVAKARKYFGKISIDHNNKELFYVICPDKESLDKITDYEDEDRQKYSRKMVEYAAGLSGGERSFSTICFIIAMWQAMKSPFYMLDEFDVFMDAQNRTVSQEALRNHARTFPNNQFFFFTPLDLTSVPPPSEALLLRLYPPRGNDRDIASNTLPDIDDPEEQARGTGSRKRIRLDNEPGPSRRR